MRTVPGLLISIPLVTALLIVNVAQMLSFVVIRPFSGAFFRRFNRYLADKWWGACVVTGEKLLGLKLVFTGESLPAKENALLIANHQSGVDILILLGLGFRKERLGDLKWFVKDVLKFVPGVGWGMLFLDCLFVKRDWMADRASIERTFARLVGHKTPVWLVSFLEGTRLRAHKVERSQNYARKKGLPHLENVMLPRTKGFVASVRGLGAHAPYIYDATIAYTTLSPTLWKWVKGKVGTVHVHLRRFPVSELPPDDAALSDWAIKLYVEKDKLLEDFKQAGRFPGPELNEPLRVQAWLCQGL